MERSPYLPTPGVARWRQTQEPRGDGSLVVCALVVIAPLFLVTFFLVARGFSSLDWNFFTQLPKPTGETGGGMANAIVGTLVLLRWRPSSACPLGVFGGIYLAEYGSDRATSGSVLPPTC